MKLDLQDRIVAEANKAEDRYGPFASTHEGLGVLTEEYHELIEAIRSNDLRRVEHEAIQVAAVAARIAECLEVPETAQRSTPSRTVPIVGDKNAKTIRR